MSSDEEEVCFLVPPLTARSINADLLPQLCRVCVNSKVSNGIFFLMPHRQSAAPTTLVPSPVPRTLFYKLKSLQPLFNELYHKVAMDSDFLLSSLSSVITSDTFCSQLWAIVRKREQLELAGKLHRCQLGVFRADYMFEESTAEGAADGHRWKARQIEVNTIASSFAGLSPEVASMHKSVLNHLSGVSSTTYQRVHMPKWNSCLATIADAFARAHNYYCGSISNEHTFPLATQLRKCVVFVVQDTEVNVLDQKKLQDQLTNTTGIVVYRRTFDELNNTTQCWVDDCGRFLIEAGRMEVSLFYFRDGYDPTAYNTQEDWDLRERMDLSMAISCPSVRYQLAGMKKIQQVLSLPGMLEKFIIDEERCKSVRSTFAQFMPLDSQSSQLNMEAVDTALKNPGRFVLKPQREGGGHNHFGEEMVSKLRELRHCEGLKAFILMERVYPFQVDNIISCCNYQLHSNDTIWTKVVSELGVYGVLMCDLNANLVLNSEAGHLLRSKDVSKLDGGVVAGNACLDSPYLV